MYALVFTDNVFGNESVKVFDTHGEAHKAMEEDFHRVVEDDDLEIEDGRCWIDEWSAYDTPDGSGYEWRIVEAEDHTKQADEK